MNSSDDDYMGCVLENLQRSPSLPVVDVSSKETQGKFNYIAIYMYSNRN